MNLKLGRIKLFLAVMLAGCFVAAAVSSALDPYKTPNEPIYANIGIAIALLGGYFSLFAYNFNRKSRGLDQEGKPVPNQFAGSHFTQVCMFMGGLGTVFLAASSWWAGGWVFDENFPAEFRAMNLTHRQMLVAYGVLMVGFAFSSYVIEQVFGSHRKKEASNLSRKSTWRRLVLVNAAALGAVVFLGGQAAGSAVRWNVNGIALYSIWTLHFVVILVGGLLLDFAARRKKENYKENQC